jgi:tetratricopeptide (TPR) repeat protein
MTDFSYLERNQNSEFQEVKKLLERAIYFHHEKEDLTQALANYIKALFAYAEYVKNMGEYLSIVKKMPINIDILPQETGLIFTKVLFDLLTILDGIIACHVDSAEKAFLICQIQIIIDELGNYQYVFDAKQLREYDLLREQDKSRKVYVDKYRESIEDLKKNYKTDKGFEKIVETLNKISAAEVCPATLGISSCFIATAAYSTSYHPDLDTFRAFRDQKLLRVPVGRLLVNIYYQIGSIFASYVSRHPIIQNFVRQQLAKLAQWMRDQSVVH